MIAAYIKKYIIENGQVGIYRLGTFERVYREAEVHPILKEFTPPGHYLSFTPDDKEEGTAFTQYVASETHVGTAEAAEQVAQWVSAVKAALEKGDRFELGTMGAFVMGNVRMEFVPALDPELSPDSFGFTSFSLRGEGRAESHPVVPEQPAAEKPAPEPEKAEPEKSRPQPEPEKAEPALEAAAAAERAGDAEPQEAPEPAPEPAPKRHVGRVIFYTVLILLLLCIIGMGVYALLRPLEFVEKKDQYVSKITSLFHGSADTLQREPEDSVLVESWWEMQEPEVNPEDTSLAAEPAEHAEPANCYIIIGGFGNAANADNLVQKLKGRYPNVSNLGLNERGTLIMVGIGPYSRAEAETQMKALEATYKDCWILEK